MGAPPPTYHVYAQGIDRNLRYTGSFDETDFGPLTLEQVLWIFTYMPKDYPPNIDFGESCPINISIDTGHSFLSIALNGRDDYLVRMYDRMSNEELLIDDSMSEERMLDVLKRYWSYPYPQYFEQIAKEVTYVFSVKSKSICVGDEGGEYSCWADTSLEVSNHKVGFVPIQSIYRIVISRGGFLSKGKIEIEYYDYQTGKLGKMVYKLKRKEDAEKIYNAIVRFVHPSRVFLK